MLLLLLLLLAAPLSQWMAAAATIYGKLLQVKWHPFVKSRTAAASVLDKPRTSSSSSSNTVFLPRPSASVCRCQRRCYSNSIQTDISHINAIAVAVAVDVVVAVVAGRPRDGIIRNAWQCCQHHHPLRCCCCGLAQPPIRPLFVIHPYLWRSVFLFLALLSPRGI